MDISIIWKALIKVLISLGTVWFGGWVLGDWYVLVWIRGLVARWDTYYQQGFIIDWLEVGSIILLRLGAPYKQICGIKVGCQGTSLVS
jgi:hypothetical protein